VRHLQEDEDTTAISILLLYLLKSAAIVAYTAIAFLFTSGFMGLPSSINLAQDQHANIV